MVHNNNRINYVDVVIDHSATHVLYTFCCTYNIVRWNLTKMNFGRKFGSSNLRFSKHRTRFKDCFVELGLYVFEDWRFCFALEIQNLEEDDVEEEYDASNYKERHDDWWSAPLLYLLEQREQCMSYQLSEYHEDDVSKYGTRVISRLVYPISLTEAWAQNVNIWPLPIHSKHGSVVLWTSGLVSSFVPVMADSLWPHKYDTIDDDLQQEHNNHGEGVLQQILFGQSIETEVVLSFSFLQSCLALWPFPKLLPLHLAIWPKPGGGGT